LTLHSYHSESNSSRNIASVYLHNFQKQNLKKLILKAKYLLRVTANLHFELLPVVVPVQIRFLLLSPDRAVYPFSLILQKQQRELFLCHYGFSLIVWNKYFPNISLDDAGDDDEIILVFFDFYQRLNSFHYVKLVFQNHIVIFQ